MQSANKNFVRVSHLFHSFIAFKVVSLDHYLVCHFDPVVHSQITDKRDGVEGETEERPSLTTKNSGNTHTPQKPVRCKGACNAKKDTQLDEGWEKCIMHAWGRKYKLHIDEIMNYHDYQVQGSCRRGLH